MRIPVYEEKFCASILSGIGAILFLIMIGLGGCATVADAPKIIQQAEAAPQALEIEGTKRTLSVQASDQAIKKLAVDDESERLLQNHLLIEQQVADSPLFAGNDAHLLFDGQQTFDAMYDAIDAAKHHINLEYFIFENVNLRNISLEALLLKKRAEGVAVNVIYDAIGSSGTPEAFFESLKNAGVKLTVFHPVDLENIHNINFRDHRKMLIVDGQLAIIGGINLSTTYQSKSKFGSSGAGKSGAKKSSSNKSEANPPAKDVKSAHWRDTDMLVKGPAVAELQRLFLSHWDSAQPLDQSTFFPAIEKKGNELIRVIGSSPINDLPRYYVTLISAMGSAEKDISLSSAYFVPTPDEKRVLIQAAQRGVNVEIMVPGLSDSKFAIYVQQSHYSDLLDAGVNIYEQQSEVLHAKTVSIDGVWSVIGSSNFDYRSAALNSEIDLVVLGRQTASELKAKFNEDSVKARKINKTAWHRRPLTQKLKEFFSRIFEKIL